MSPHQYDHFQTLTPGADSSRRLIALLRLPGKAVVAFGGDASPTETLPEPGDEETFFYAPFQEGTSPVWSLPEKLNVDDAIADIDQLEYELEGSVIPATPRYEYDSAANSLLEKLLADDLQKAVLSRVITAPQSKNFSATACFKMLCDTYPTAAVHLFALEGTEIWLGSSPELLLSFKENELRTVSLAATQPLNEQQPETLNWSEKELKEQSLVTGHIDQVLNDQEGIVHVNRTGPESVAAGKIAHLKTSFSATTDAAFKWGELVKKLHPTPAICGWPTLKAMDVIEQFEQHTRSYYGGFFGVGSQQSAELHLNLRCMRISINVLQLFVGGGYTAESDVNAEWNETEHKAQTLLSVVENLQNLASS